EKLLRSCGQILQCCGVKPAVVESALEPSACCTPEPLHPQSVAAPYGIAVAAAPDPGRDADVFRKNEESGGGCSVARPAMWATVRGSRMPIAYPTRRSRARLADNSFEAKPSADWSALWPG